MDDLDTASAMREQMRDTADKAVKLSKFLMELGDIASYAIEDDNRPLFLDVLWGENIVRVSVEHVGDPSGLSDEQRALLHDLSLFSGRKS